MADFLFEYGLFLAKAVTVLIVTLLLLAGIIALSSRGRRADHSHGEIVLHSLNDELDGMKDSIEAAVMDKDAYKALAKAQKKKDKQEKKQRKQAAKTAQDPADEGKKRVYVLDFEGDIKATEVALLREEISAILTFARPQDEVVLRLESSGGLVHSYGLAASQLERIKARQIPLTICVDEVAASGGYLMACLADKLLAAPFALLGSIGVVAQLPNFHRVLKKHDVDYEMYTAGEYKRTITVFGENTEKGKRKFVEELEDTHDLFKAFVSRYRPQLDMTKVATGEVWFGQRAIELKLLDELRTSDDYLMDCCQHADVYQVHYEVKKTLQERLSAFTIQASEGVLTKVWSKLADTRLLRR